MELVVVYSDNIGVFNFNIGGNFMFLLNEVFLLGENIVFIIVGVGFIVS